MSGNSVEQIKGRLSIVDVVGSYIKLEKAGGNFRAACPFHAERTPSFFVSPVRDSYHCFGCNRGGDIFSFVEEIEGLDFKGALKVLADKAGVTLLEVNPALRSEKEQLHGLLEEATKLFQFNLIKNKEALSYLYGRGVTADTLKQFRIGFAPGSWTFVRDALLGKGFTEEEIQKAGLIIKSPKGYYDRFRSRIMFPLADSAGRIVGFSGRIFGDEESKMGKYINSPETILFSKSQLLYGYDKAKSEIRKQNTCILVEGQMDLLMAHQAGFSNTVAVSGTALTDSHLRTIKRLANTLVIAFDADVAGNSASGKGALLGMSLGMEVKVVPMPQGLDPADVIAKDVELWKKNLKEAKHIVHFYLEILGEKHLESREFRVAVGKLVLPFIKHMGNKIEQAHFVEEVAQRLNIPQEPIWAELEKMPLSLGNEIEKEENPPLLKEVPHSRKDIIEQQIMSILFWQKSLKEPAVSVLDLEKRLESVVGSECMEELRRVPADEKRERVFEVEIYFEGERDVGRELGELFVQLEKEAAQNAFTTAMGELKEAEGSGDKTRVSELLQKCQELAKQIKWG
ncbi:MAG: DNA primase [Candidatus Yonathbacteria bacterium]|nr:DNA primase [Candidatus Yonathbacteria bacterium]